MTKQFSDLQGTVATLTAQVAQAKKDKRLVEFTAKAGEWKAIAGKPEDMAAELVSLDEQNPKLAEAMVKRYTDMNSALVAAGVLSLKGTPGKDDEPKEDIFVGVMRKYAADNKITDNQAMARLSIEKPDDFAAYRNRIGQ